MSEESNKPLDEIAPEAAEINVEGAEPVDMSADSAPESVQTVDAIMQEMQKLQSELDLAREQALRAQAELQNVRRRAEQDVEKAHKFGQEKLIADLLSVVDNLERSVAALSSDNALLKPLLEGVQLTLKSFLDTLSKHKVETIDPVGEPFDPQSHQAMTMVENPDVEPNTVIDVFQKGYRLHGRLVRPAMVVVSKTPAADA